VTVVTGEKVAEFTKSDDVVVVGYFQPGSAEEKEFAKVAEKFRNDYAFGSVKAPSVVLFKKFDEGFAAFDGKVTEESLTSFIQSESVPLMAEIGPENYMKYFESKLPLAYFFYADDEQRGKFGPLIESAIKEFKGKINAVYIKASQFGQHAESLNLKKEWPGFVVHSMEKDLKYPFEGKEITKEAISKFVGGILSGEIKPSFKSEPIPEKDEGPVKVLVHDNFNKNVFESKKDALVEFYAPWCGACKNLAPIYEKLAAKYAKVKGGDSLIIAKMNAVANDLPESLNFELRAYPTIKFFKAGSKEPVEFDGEHTLKSFVDFLNKQTTKLNNVQLEKAEIEEEEARIQKAKEAREKAQKDAEEAKKKKKQDSKDTSSDDSAATDPREEL
jgi:protein disulfide-isomerase A1